MRQDLNLFPYKIQILQAQTAANKEEGRNFCVNISQRIENQPNLLDLIFFSDEVHFHLSGHVIKQNMRFWAEAQPHEHVVCPLSTEKVTMWCANGRSGIIRPYWFEDERRRPVTINTE